MATVLIQKTRKTSKADRQITKTNEGTYCKLGNYETSCKDTSVCETCQAYRRWGKDRQR